MRIPQKVIFHTRQAIYRYTQIARGSMKQRGVRQEDRGRRRTAADEIRAGKNGGGTVPFRLTVPPCIGSFPLPSLAVPPEGTEKLRSDMG